VEDICVMSGWTLDSGRRCCVGAQGVTAGSPTPGGWIGAGAWETGLPFTRCTAAVLAADALNQLLTGQFLIAPGAGG
jgi:hypothetical protein